MKDLSIVIVTYKEELTVLRDCFQAVVRSQDVGIEIFVVDNGGREETRTLLAELLPSATYFANPENQGFAAAVNQGMRLAGGRYILLLNPDTNFAPDVLKNMIGHLDRDVMVGIGSCVIRYPDGTLQESIRRFPTLSDQLITLLKLPHFIKRLPAIDKYLMRDVDPYATQDVDSIMGAFMFIRRELLTQVGLFDERYFNWFEEVDYCKMARNAGFTTRHYGDVWITHHKGHTFNQLSTLRKQKWIRQSMRKYMSKHHGPVPRAILWLLAPLFIALAYGVLIVKRK